MKVIAEISITPMGVGASMSEYVAACEHVLSSRGLKLTMHAQGTNVEGPWDLVMDGIKGCHEKVHAMGAPRINTVIQLSTRTDRDQSMDEEVRSVERILLRAG
jgi:uncharacterized protein (TIGR00106 family)